MRLLALALRRPPPISVGPEHSRGRQPTMPIVPVQGLEAPDCTVGADGGEPSGAGRRGAQLADDEPLMQIVEGAAVEQPRQPAVELLTYDELELVARVHHHAAYALGCSCRGLHTQLTPLLQEQYQKHVETQFLCDKMGSSVALLRGNDDIYWSGRGLGALDCAKLAGLFLMSELRSLTVLNLSDNALGSEGVRLVAGGFGGLPSLVQLNLNRTDAGDDAMGALAAGLRALPRLAHLMLDHNSIGDEGAAELIAQPLPMLETLSVFNNAVGENGKALLAGSQRAGGALPKLRHLWV